MGNRFSSITESILRDAGWRPGRLVDTREWETFLWDRLRMPFHRKAREFLEEFGHLKLTVVDDRPEYTRCFQFDPVDAAASADHIIEEPVDVADLAKAMGFVPTLIGTDVEYGVLLMNDEGAVFKLDYDCTYLGSTSMTGDDALEVFCKQKVGIGGFPLRF